MKKILKRVALFSILVTTLTGCDLVDVLNPHDFSSTQNTISSVVNTSEEQTSTNHPEIESTEHEQNTNIEEGQTEEPVVVIPDPAPTDDPVIVDPEPEVPEITEEKDAWTILIYMCGSDLESAYANKTSVDGYEWDGRGLATMDIAEILSVEDKPDDINIVLETGGAKTWTNKTYGKYGDYSINASKLQRHHVENGKIVLDETLSTYVSMGNSETLESFLEYGFTTYPAEKTALILWNHGGGLQGVCFDEKSNDDSLETSEVVSAVSLAKSKCNISDKLEFIGYDACLMQLQDIAMMNAPYFNYMVAAQETESGEGWSYESWIDDLYKKAETEVILQEIVDGFIEANGGVNDSRNDQTLSYLDLSYADEYKSTWENMALRLNSKITNSNKSTFMSNVVKKSKYYAGSDYYAYYGLFDVKDFMTKLKSNSTLNPGNSYIESVLSVFDNFVVYSKCGKGAGKSYGLSMYYSVSVSSGYYGTISSSDYNNYRVGYETTLSNWANLVANCGG